MAMPHRCVIASGLLLLVTTSQAPAWGPEGHTVIGRVAVQNASPQAKTDIDWIVAHGAPVLNQSATCRIDPNARFTSVDFRDPVHTDLANWPDCFRAFHPETGPWHFEDIPLADDLSNRPPDQINKLPLDRPWCKPGGCVSQAVATNLRALSASPTDPAQTLMTLAYVIHFVGDLHQPLHAEDNKDQGGNEVTVDTTSTFPPDQPNLVVTKLHTLWDGPLVDVAVGSNEDAATATIASLVKAQGSQWADRGSSLEDVISASEGWIVESHQLARPAYAMLSPSPAFGAGPVGPISIPPSYVTTESKIVRLQLAKASARLTAALNAALTWNPPVTDGSRH